MKQKPTYSVTVVDASEQQFKWHGKWSALLDDVREQFKLLQPGKSLRVEFSSLEETKTFGYAAKKQLPKTKGLIVGISLLQKAVYVGRNQA